MQPKSAGWKDFALELESRSGKFKAMSQGLHLSQRMSLSQVLAPQLQQSLALLQAPTLELKALVEQEVQHEPLPGGSANGGNGAAGPQPRRGHPGQRSQPTWPNRPATSCSIRRRRSRAARRWTIFRRNLTRRCSRTRNGGTIFPKPICPTAQGPEAEERRQFMFDSLVASTSLQETLLEQMRFPNDRRAAAHRGNDHRQH
jgi:DNA-directed RNA polymerase specialized sigma54-like protein